MSEPFGQLSLESGRLSDGVHGGEDQASGWERFVLGRFSRGKNPTLFLQMGEGCPQLAGSFGHAGADIGDGESIGRSIGPFQVDGGGLDNVFQDLPFEPGEMFVFGWRKGFARGVAFGAFGDRFFRFGLAPRL